MAIQLNLDSKESFSKHNLLFFSGNAIIISFLTIILVVILILGMTLVYRHNDNIKKRYETMKKWTFVLPAAAYARETIVKFDMVLRTFQENSFITNQNV